MRAVTFLCVDQCSSRRLEKIGEDTPTCPEVKDKYMKLDGQGRAHTLNFRPKFKFLQYFFGGGPRTRWGVR